jgi:hypothetical protein
MSDGRVVELPGPASEARDSLTEVLREGAQGLWPGQLRPKWTLSWPHMRSYGMSMAAG